MVSAYVLVSVEPGKNQDVVAALRGVGGVKQAHACWGQGPHWRTFFKGGWRGSPRGQLVHQVARLERGKLSIAIAVLTDGNPSQAYGRETVRGIAARLVRQRSRSRLSPQSRQSARLQEDSMG